MSAKRDRAEYMRAFMANKRAKDKMLATRLPSVGTNVPPVSHDDEVVSQPKLPWTKPVVKELFGIEAIVRRAALGLQTAPDAACLTAVNEK
jgi:hypothetical protein